MGASRQAAPRASGRPAALTSAEGRVIASTSSEVVPGQRIAVARAAPAPAPIRSWRVVDLA
jgi:hypothetical protein